MKVRWIIIATTALIIISAGPVLTTEPPVTEAPVVKAVITETGALPDDALARKSGCFECHSVDKTVHGPAFNDVATKYKDDARARDRLIQTVKKGGKGNWTKVTRGVPMPAFSPRLSDSEITRLVDWVLTLQTPQ